MCSPSFVNEMTSLYVVWMWKNECRTMGGFPWRFKVYFSVLFEASLILDECNNNKKKEEEERKSSGKEIFLYIFHLIRHELSLCCSAVALLWMNVNILLFVFSSLSTRFLLCEKNSCEDDDDAFDWITLHTLSLFVLKVLKVHYCLLCICIIIILP